MTNRRLLLVLAMIALLIALAAVLPAVASAGEEEVSVIRPVRIRDFAYRPRYITGVAGDTVGWRNVGAVDHTVTSDAGLFDSGPIPPGGTFLWTPPGAGMWTYRCTIHPTMRGAIAFN
jgi:plastocyanin